MGDVFKRMNFRKAAGLNWRIEGHELSLAIFADMRSISGPLELLRTSRLCLFAKAVVAG